MVLERWDVELRGSDWVRVEAGFDIRLGNCVTSRLIQGRRVAFWTKTMGSAAWRYSGPIIS